MSNELLHEEIESLKMLLDHAGYDYHDGAEQDILKSLSSLNLPEIYHEFLQELDPGNSQWRIGPQLKVKLHRSDELPEWQSERERDDQLAFGHLNDQVLLLESGTDDEEMGPPVYRLDADGEKQCISSSFIQFLKILRAGMDMLSQVDDFEEDEAEMEDSYDDFNDYGETTFEGGRQDLLNGYLDEIENIDPDCADSWVLT